MEISDAGIRQIIETEKIFFKLKKKIVTKPKGKERFILSKKVELILTSYFKKTNTPLKKFNLKCYLPLKSFFDLKKGKVLAWLLIGEKRFPAIVETKKEILLAFDLGKTFLELLNEKYFQEKKEKHALSLPFFNVFYKIIPYSLRVKIYRDYYKRLHGKIKNDEFNTQFPIDPAGFVLHHLLIEIIKKNSDYIQIAYWPAGYQAAFMLTHDVEPTDYSYKKGIFILLNKIKNSKSTINLVGKSVKDKLNKCFFTTNEIGCHGYAHDRTFSLIDEETRDKQIKKAKATIEKKFKKKIFGFRAPTLQKTRDMYKLLWKNGFEYDTSTIDTQREEPNCGKGVSYNLPYHPFNFENKLFESILEIPTSAPDCISPFYFGYTLNENAQIFESKKEWLYHTGGVANFIIHAPAWGKKDANLRMALLDKIQNTGKEGFWLAQGKEIYGWWEKRRKIKVFFKNNKWLLESDKEINNLKIELNNKKIKTNLLVGENKWISIK